ncbi:PREDICTED: uncharacterized protein LOC101298261 [Fragaria vesca subsp. vesca]|uniref:uncharacterized protein LOC101298261 n=1 Tax=Fragaria vesca subsp. vesca TaxID=101020 RepID=UPI0002C36780|nr:PREDICTED: uncharacterized protein LOC101298261 [Fragaria vesca subsp. vesca]
MAKFNEVQKKKRAQNQENKRRIHGDPVSGKLHLKQQPVSISGKRKRKLEKKWRRDQKEAVEKGLITMEDVEMAAADTEESEGTKKGSKKFHMKKSVRLKQAKHKGKKKGKSSKPASASQASVDVMVE